MSQVHDDSDPGLRSRENGSACRRYRQLVRSRASHSAANVAMAHPDCSAKLNTLAGLQGSVGSRGSVPHGTVLRHGEEYG